MIVLKHELRMNVKGLMIWALSIGLFGFVFLLMYPSLEDVLAEMTASYANMGGFTQAFGLDKIGMDTIMGFYATEIGAFFCLGGGLFAAILGTGMLSKEEGGHTAEFLFTLPIGRTKIMLQKFLSLLVLILAFNIICVAFNSLAFFMIGESIEQKGFLLYHGAQLVMHMEIACICFMLSAFTKKTSLGIGLGMVIFLYAGDMMAKIIPDLEILKYITPFYYATASDIISSQQIEMSLLGIGLVIAVISTVAAFAYYKNKDLAA